MQLILSGTERRDNVLKRLQTHCKGTLTRECDGNSIPIIVGNLNGADKIQIECIKQKIPYIFIDHGYFTRSHELEWARFCVNNFHCTDWRTSDKEIPPVKDYKQGEYITIFPPSEKATYIYGLHDWVDKTVEKIRAFTDRRIVIKRKGEHDCKKSISEAHVVVSFGSVADVQASICGVPVIVSSHSPAIPISNTFENIENLQYPDRTQWLRSIASAEWHKDEMDKCWARLKGQLEEI